MKIHILIIVMILALLIGVITALITSCATTNDAPPALEQCDAFMSRRIAGLAKLRTVPVESGTAITVEGVILWVQLVNLGEKRIYAEVLVDTDDAAKAVTKEGLKPSGSCQRGGKAWQAFSGSIGQLKGRDASGTN